MIDADAVLSSLSLSDKCNLLGGDTNWRTRPIPHAGIPALKMTDGPTGVRGEGHGGAGTHGVAVPSGITLGASWDTQLLAEIGDLLGRECVRKGAHILLGPTVNLHRTPLGGRTFECYSEDPELSGALASSYIRSVQSHHVAATVKHFVGNDTETERMTVDLAIDERTLREVYLRPFERAVTEGGAWGIMSAYNRLDGQHCAQHRRLLTDILRNEWGFGGFVVSDWFGAHDTVGSARAGLTIEMPGPARIYGDDLAAAVERGEVSESAVDALVRDVVKTINRTRADERNPNGAERAVDDPTERALTRRAAVAGTVLLRNEPVGDAAAPALPLDPHDLTSLAVVGPNAAMDHSMGGGSASLTRFAERTLLDALIDRLAEVQPNCTVVHEPGVRIDRLTPVPRTRQLETDTGEPGLTLEYFNGSDWDAPADLATTTESTLLRFFGTTPVGIDPRTFGARLRGRFIPDDDGPHTFGVVSTGPVSVQTDVAGERFSIADDPDMKLPRSAEFFGYGSIEVTRQVECRAGEPVELSAKWATDQGNGFAALRIGIRPPEPADLIERAAEAARAADAAIVMVGTNDEWETEGFDRTDLNLPGQQDELVERVVAANPNTTVIVNAGAPVAMDWAGPQHASPAPAVLTSFFAGQEQAEGLVDVVFGETDPGGRLPTTYPKRLEDTPAYLHQHPDHDSAGNATQRYAEGFFIGYRWYDARDIEPRYPFGHGLSFGTTQWGTPTASATSISLHDLAAGATIDVHLSISATNERPATIVAQGYVAPIDATMLRPIKELKTWSKTQIMPGQSTDVVLQFSHAAFHYWDLARNSWHIEPGRYDLIVARSARDIHSRLHIDITAN